jgi:hypothetical protein
MKKYMMVVALFMLAVHPLLGQIVITWDELPKDLGTNWTNNEADSVVVSVGSTGGPQNWNFTAQPMGDENTQVTVVPRLSTPFGDSFPTANLVVEIVSDADTVYSYAGGAVTYVCNLGLGSIADADTYCMRFDPVDTVPLPLMYGNSRPYHYALINTIDSITVLLTDNYGFETIDAYGSISIPYGTYNCLRICYFDTIISTLYYQGYPVYVDTTTHIIYDYYTEDYGLLVHVLSYEDETNPQYNQALMLERLTQFSSSIEEANTQAQSLVFFSPNPFSDAVDLSYSLARYSEVRLIIYDAGGRHVATLINGAQPPGTYSVRWNACDRHGNRMCSGVYFYEYTVEGITSQGKLLLIK